MKTATASRQGRVLVVEDERDVAELIRHNLTREGYDVVIAPTGTDALKQVREARPDVVLLDDIMVPHLNGALARVSAPRAAVFLNVQPIVGALLGVLLLGDVLTPFIGVGGGLIVLGLALTVRNAR